ncbi:hypothetical protein CaCOL14_005936 [Colletotrichum acutatum]
MHNSTGPQSSNHNQPIHISSMIPLTSLTHPFSHLTKPQISPHPKTHYNIRPRSGDAQKMKKGNLTPKVREIQPRKYKKPVPTGNLLTDKPLPHRPSRLL